MDEQRGETRPEPLNFLEPIRVIPAVPPADTEPPPDAEPVAAGPVRASNRRQIAIVAGITAFVVIAAAAAFALRPRGPAQYFSYAFTQGETIVYDFTYSTTLLLPAVATAFGKSQDVADKLKGTIELRVVDTQTDGSATVDVTLTATDDDGPRKLTDKPIRLEFRRDGRITDSESTGLLFALPNPINPFGGSGVTDPDAAAGHQGIFPVFPQEAIREGDAWTQSYAVPVHTEEITSVSVNGTHEGHEETAFGRAAKIRQVVNVPLDFSFSFKKLFASLPGRAQEIGAGAAPVPGAMLPEFSMAGTYTADTLALVLASGEAVRISTTVKFQMDVGMQVPGVVMPDAAPASATATLDLARKS